MSSTIAKLWNGDLAPAAHCGKNDWQIGELLELMERHRKSLFQALDPAQKDTLEKYIGCMDEYVTLLTEQAFSEGFRLGSRLLTEALL